MLQAETQAGRPVSLASVSLPPRTLPHRLSLCSLQTVVKLEGENKLVTSFKNIKSVTELSGDTIINVSWFSELWLPELEWEGQQVEE